MAPITALEAQLRAAPRTWLVTGVAGFIGSHLLEALLRLGQRVTGLDNFSVGRRENLAQVRAAVGEEAWGRFRLIHGDICVPASCTAACAGSEFVLHQAALGSVPRSIEEPLAAHHANVTGFLNVLLAARDAGARRFVYASSSAVYGDDPRLPKVERETGRLLSPYAATKWLDEVYAGVCGRLYGLPTIGLRYFNVFGTRQDPAGAYAAVIPKWVSALLRREPVFINGDGETSRDFCHVSNVVQANLLAALAEADEAQHECFNIGMGERTTLNELFYELLALAARHEAALAGQKPAYREFRAGDIRHSHADISKARRLLGYAPGVRLREGLEQAFDWYRANGV